MKREEHLSESALEVLESHWKGHNLILTKKAVQEGSRIIVAAGGDGTINEVINGFIGSDITLAIIPWGTANDLASNIEIDTQKTNLWQEDYIYSLKKLDLISVNGRYFATVGGFGLASAAVAWSNQVRKRMGVVGKIARWAGSLIYLLSVPAVYPEYRSNPISVCVKIGQRIQKEEIFSLILANQPFFGKWFNIAPQASNTDGLIDICLIPNTQNLLQSLNVIFNVLNGTHIQTPYVKYWQDSRVSITSEKPIAFFGDGEIFEINTHFEVKLVPEALNILVPKSENSTTQMTKTYPINRDKRIIWQSKEKVFKAK